MNNFILVHGLDMRPALVNVDDISYVNEDDGSATIWLRSRLEEVIQCHETLQQITDMIYEEQDGNCKDFWKYR